MNDDFNESDLEQTVGNGGVTPSFNGFGQFDGFKASFDDARAKDIRSINERGKNQEIRNTDEDYGSTSSKNKKNKKEDEDSDDITGSKKGKGSDELESGKSDKDKEEDKDSKKKDSDGKSKDSDDKKDDKKADKNEGAKGKGESKDKDGDGGGIKDFFKNKFAKYKIIAYAIIAILAVFLVVFLVFAIITAIDNLTLGLVSFFGVPEAQKEETGNLRGLYDDDKYLFDENNNVMNREELLDYLERNKACDGNFWTSISDGWTRLWNLDVTDFCQLLRHIQKRAEETHFDQALIFTTLFYGYDTTPTVEFYNNPDDAPDSTPALEHYQNLAEILNDKNNHIKLSDVDTIINNSEAKKTSYYYSWTIDVNKDEETGKVKSITGRCEYNKTESYAYNLDKWKVYMRFGAEISGMFDDVVLKTKNYEASSDECKDASYTEENLKEQLRLAAKNYGDDVTYSLNMGSVNKARNALETPDPTGSELFYQAANLETKTKDYFESYNGKEFDYRNGYVYQNYPTFKPSMEPGGEYYGKVRIEYDDIFTPKEVEQVIQNIVDRKTNMNYALNREDPDVQDDYTSSLNGYTGVPTGANCMQYLPASLNEIQVKLTDCLGSYMATTTFADYIIGVANGEVSNKNDDYVKAQMVAAISYALKRRNNYTRNPIEMRSGNCDQVYCSMMKGCTSKNTPINGDTRFHSYYIGGSKAYPQLYAKYQALYEEASDYLLVKDGTVFNAHYINTSQNRWYQKAVSGMSFTQIMQEEYAGEGATLIKCTDGNSTPADPDTPTDDDGGKVGNKPTDEYPNVSPDKGIYYGFSYKDGTDGTHITINPDWKNENLVTVSPVCSGNKDFESKKYTIHKKAVNSFEKAFKKVCTMLTSGVKITSGETCKYTIDDLQDGTVFIERKSSGGTFDSHAYGIAQDFNYSKKITVNGKTYQPYNTRDLSEYLEFVNAIGGKEENCKNVNYILWAYAYKDAGFYWGGNDGRNGNSGSFDGKLFELKYN